MDGYIIIRVIITDCPHSTVGLFAHLKSGKCQTFVFPPSCCFWQKTELMKTNGRVRLPGAERGGAPRWGSCLSSWRPVWGKGLFNRSRVTQNPAGCLSESLGVSRSANTKDKRETEELADLWSVIMELFDRRVFITERAVCGVSVNSCRQESLHKWSLATCSSVRGTSVGAKLG